MIKQELIDFEQAVAAEYNAGRIHAPVHLSGGNEDQLLEVFKRVKPHDHVFSTWRSHYHALLHGIPRDLLMRKILAGESITICSPEHRFYSSAICGGNLSIALGVAWAEKWGVDQCSKTGVKLQGAPVHVWCFVGDMAAEQGAFAECTRYAANHDLPITYVVEDNGKCVNTPTAEVWGKDWEKGWKVAGDGSNPKVIRYQYQLIWPHMGAGAWVDFGTKKLQPTGGM